MDVKFLDDGVRDETLKLYEKIRAAYMRKAVKKEVDGGNVTKRIYVYMLVNPLNCLPFYIGTTKNVEMTLSKEKSSYSNLRLRKIVDGILSSGREPSLVVCGVKSTRCEALIAKEKWIAKYARLGFLVNSESELQQEAEAIHAKSFEMG